MLPLKQAQSSFSDRSFGITATTSRKVCFWGSAASSSGVSSREPVVAWRSFGMAPLASVPGGVPLSLLLLQPPSRKVHYAFDEH